MGDRTGRPLPSWILTLSWDHTGEVSVGAVGPVGVPSGQGGGRRRCPPPSVPAWPGEGGPFPWLPSAHTGSEFKLTVRPAGRGWHGIRPLGSLPPRLPVGCGLGWPSQRERRGLEGPSHGPDTCGGLRGSLSPLAAHPAQCPTAQLSGEQGPLLASGATPSHHSRATTSSMRDEASEPLPPPQSPPGPPESPPPAECHLALRGCDI